MVVKTLGDAMSCPLTSEPKFSLEVVLVTIMPAAVEITSAGSWATRPLPTVSRANFFHASPAGRPCWNIPMAKPPRRFRTVMKSAAMASPFTNFEAPSMAP